MKTKAFFTAILFAVTLSASAQVEFLYTDFGRNVICREKKLFWMDGDSIRALTLSTTKKWATKRRSTLPQRRRAMENIA